MYDDLVKRLRNAAQWADKGLVIMPSICLESAEAIVELQKIASKLLEKYQEQATSVICEYSGNIDEDIDRLNEEVRTLMAQINGMPLIEPPKEET